MWHDIYIRGKLDGWKEEDPEPGHNQQEFANRLTITHIGRTDKGTYSLQYHDGHMFGGHPITIHLNKDFECVKSYW
jgi:hypothetical protein